jgi:hypothetical protein
MQKAVSALEAVAIALREQAVYFPAEAQDALAQLPQLYESRLSIISKLRALSDERPPSSDDEFSAWTQLMDGYDQLRVQSLGLLRSLDPYTRQS